MRYIKDVIEFANGNKAKAGRIMGVSKQAVHQASEDSPIPSCAILKVEAATGWSLSDIRPDLYPPERFGDVIMYEGDHKCVYFISGDRFEPTGFYKVGISGGYKSRISAIRHNSPFNIITVLMVLHSDPRELEKLVMHEFAEHSFKGEWFKVGDGSRNLQRECKIFEATVKKFIIDNCDGEIIYEK